MSEIGAGDFTSANTGLVMLPQPCFCKNEKQEMLQFISAYSNRVVCVKIKCLNLKIYMLDMADLSYSSAARQS